MNNIIEKLGIKPIGTMGAVMGGFGSMALIKLSEVRELEQQRNEMLEALIMDEVGIILLKAVTKEKTRTYYNIDDAFINSKRLEIIERATGKSWEEIKELFNE